MKYKKLMEVIFAVIVALFVVFPSLFIIYAEAGNKGVNYGQIAIGNTNYAFANSIEGLRVANVLLEIKASLEKFYAHYNLIMIIVIVLLSLPILLMTIKGIIVMLTHFQKNRKKDENSENKGENTNAEEPASSALNDKQFEGIQNILADSQQVLSSILTSNSDIQSTQNETNRLLGSLIDKLDSFEQAIRELNIGVSNRGLNDPSLRESNGKRASTAAISEPAVDHLKNLIDCYRESQGKNDPVRFLKNEYISVISCGVPENKRAVVANDQMPKNEYTEFENDVIDGKLLAIFLSEEPDKCYIVPEPSSMRANHVDKLRHGFSKIFDGVSSENEILIKPAVFGRKGNLADFTKFIDKGELK